MSVTMGSDDSVPLPLSFPSILRNPGIARFAYLSAEAAQSKPTVPKKHKILRTDNEGRRWTRRRDNARFTGNIHIVQPSRRDYLPPQGPHIRPTFPEPLPIYLARNNKLPAAAIPIADPTSLDCGRFSLGLKGMRRDLRKMAFRSKQLVGDIEMAVVDWLETGGTLLSPDAPQGGNISSGTPIGTTATEISRTPLQLVWMTDESDPFTRYVIHCTARYYKIVSFSKEVSGQRLTYLLRPNVQYPDYHAAIGVDTPPATDIDLSSQLDTDSELASDHDTRSEAGDSVAGSIVEHMSTIEEDGVLSPRLPPAPESIEDDWSEVGDVDNDGDESGMGESVSSLAVDPDATMVVETRLAQLSLRARSWEHAAQTRSSSSPSRSPVRPPRRSMPAVSSIRPIIPPQSFYEYLFS